MGGSMQGKVAVVTGGTKGLGRAMADLLAKEGAAVYAAARGAEEAASARQPGPASGEVQPVRLDVGDEAQVVSLFRRIAETHGRLDVLVNNAGIGVFKPVEETTLAEWEAVMRTNVTGVFLCSREAFGLMKRQGGGRIINISSIAGYLPLAENTAYGASKYAVRGFSGILNEEGKAHGVRVSVVSPGAVYSDIWEGREGFSPADMLQAGDVAEAVLDIARRPLHVRIDEVKILPPKGVL